MNTTGVGLQRITTSCNQFELKKKKAVHMLCILGCGKVSVTPHLKMKCCLGWGPQPLEVSDRNSFRDPYLVYFLFMSCLCVVVLVSVYFMFYIVSLCPKCIVFSFASLCLISLI